VERAAAHNRLLDGVLGVFGHRTDAEAVAVRVEILDATAALSP
jgi:hypothetical protein